MFLGTYQTQFSGLNRLVLPKKFRSQIKNPQIVLTLGLDPCIWGWSIEDFEKQAREQLEIPLTEERGRILRRQFFSEAEICDLDKQGRFVIPLNLAKLIDLKEEVVIIGAGDHFEIWNPEKLKAFDKNHVS